jgi:adenosylhomocysteine nucleosidase
LQGKLGHGEVVLACTGEGRRRALRETAELLTSRSVDLLLGLGTAGGLTPSLARGTLVVASRLSDGESPGPEPDRRWLERALALPGTIDGTVLSSDRILCSAAEKAAARSRLAPPGPAVVDLESAAFATAAEQAGVPCLIVRAVCDAAEDNLPIDLNLCRSADGSIDRFKVVRKSVFSPGTARQLLRLRKQVATASEQLARFVVALLQEEDRGRD